MLYAGLKRRDTDRLPPPPARPKCPRCGATVIYQGLTDLECNGEFSLEGYTRHCPNYCRSNEQDTVKPNTRAWARLLRHRGLQFQCTVTYHDGTKQKFPADPWAGWGHADEFGWEVKP